MIARLLNAIRTALANSVRALCAWGDDVLLMPWHVLQAVRDAVYGAPPAGPNEQEVPSEKPTSMGPEAQRRAMVERGLLPLDIEPGPDGRDPLGEIVKQYAATPSAKRSRISLEKLSPPQIAWLTSLPEGDLAKLAAANAVHCGRLARGRKVSVTGVERCREDREYVAAPAPAELRPEPVLVRRIRELARKREEEAARSHEHLDDVVERIRTVADRALRSTPPIDAVMAGRSSPACYPA